MVNKRLLFFVAIGLAIFGFILGKEYNSFTKNNHTNNPDDDSEFVTWQDLESGKAEKEGYGLTVFKGTEVEKFYVTYEGVTPHFIYPKGKVILVRMGKPLEGSSVLAGMSGSPVYFRKNGKWLLAGAIAFGFMSPTVGPSLGGITPIQLMLEQEKSVGLVSLKENLKDKKLEDIFRPIEINQGGYKMKLLQPAFTVISKSTNKTNGEDGKLVPPKPGEAVTMLFADGDYKFGGTCTVTYVTKNRFWLCGHPVLREGKIITPAHKASIATSYKSPDFAFKIVADQHESVGYVSYDNTFAVEGEIKPLPKNAMFPVKINLDIKGKKPIEINYRVIKNKLFTEMLINYVSGMALESVWNSKEKMTSESSAVVQFDNQTIKIKNISLSGEITRFGPWVSISDPWVIVNKSANLVGKLMSSDWGFKVKSVEAKIKLSPGNKTLYLDSYKLVDRKGKIINKPMLGEKISLLLGIRDSNGAKKFFQKVPIKMPKKIKLPKEKEMYTEIPMFISIQSGNNFSEEDENKALNHRPENKKEALKELLANQKNLDTLYIQLVIPELATKKNKLKLSKKYGSKWSKVNKLDFLRVLKPHEKKVVLKEIRTPLKNYSLDVKERIDLTLVISTNTTPSFVATPVNSTDTVTAPTDTVKTSTDTKTP